MDFIDKVRQFSLRVDSLKDSVLTEEATKTALVMPFFSMLGYDVFNPDEFVPEYTADVGIKKGEKVDYAIMQDGKPVILIECKKSDSPLDKHDSQLFRYFGTTTSKFAILTNGIIYRFYTDLDETNKMDSTPFLELDLLNVDEIAVSEVKKFCKENFDVTKIFDTASELKYTGLIKRVLRDEFSMPSDNFVRFILSDGVYEGVKTQGVVDKYRPLVKKALSQFLNDLVNDKIQTALKSGEEAGQQEEQPQEEHAEEPLEEKSRYSVVTTEDEMQAFYIIRSILRDVVPMNRLSYKDTVNYFGVNLDDKATKWVCRLTLKESSKTITIPQSDTNIKYALNSIDDIYNMKDALCARINDLLNS